MKTNTRYIAAILILALTLGIAGCSAKNVSQARARKAFEKFGAEKIDESKELMKKIYNYQTECEGGCYYTTDDGDEARLIVENVILRTDERPDRDYRACTYFVAASEEDDNSMAIIYILTFGDEKDAANWFKNTSDNYSYKDTYIYGKSSGIEYAVCNDLSVQSMNGVYKQGKTVLCLVAFASETSGLKPYEGIINDMGLVSPLGT